MGYHNSKRTGQHYEDDGRVVDGDRDSDGERMPENCYCVGSGSILAYGVLDAGFRYDLTDD